VVDLDRLIKVDQVRREMVRRIDALRAEHKQQSKEKPTANYRLELRTAGEVIKKQAEQLQSIDVELNQLMGSLPNIVHPDVPVGKDESDNVVVRTVGKIPEFSFQTKEHWQLGAARDLIDIERASEVSGNRFAYLKGDLVLLQFALIVHTLSVVTNEKILENIANQAGISTLPKPFLPIIPPVMMRPDVMQKMGRLEPREERYHIKSDDLYLVGSAEHTLGPLHIGETIAEAKFPIRYIGYSTSFRREAGSYGKDMKGILRLHQFDKLEFESFTLPEAGEAEQDFLIAIQEYLMQSLGIPYRVVLKCTGDMGKPDYREFDIEAWLPGQKSYRETHTADYMTDWQSRRLHTKVKKKDGTTAFVHMNDATVLAIGRTLIAIMENYQQADGSIQVPTILQKIVGKKII